MAHFIELHKDDSDSTSISINVDFIVSVEPYDRNDGSFIKYGVESNSGGLQCLRVKETYSYVKQQLGF